MCVCILTPTHAEGVWVYTPLHGQSVVLGKEPLSTCAIHTPWVALPVMSGY